ncbi:MAG TPA: stress response translation initiation inhibitor YciH [Cellvibrionaceae bacterium]
MNKNSRLVYSTETGRVKADEKQPATQQIPGDGVVRIHRESKGRGGKTVTVITGLPLTESELKKLGKQLKQLCGTGGAVKEDTIEIQGEHRDKLKSALEALGYNVKLAGG